MIRKLCQRGIPTRKKCVALALRGNLFSGTDWDRVLLDPVNELPNFLRGEANIGVWSLPECSPNCVPCLRSDGLGHGLQRSNWSRHCVKVRLAARISLTQDACRVSCGCEGGGQGKNESLRTLGATRDSRARPQLTANILAHCLPFA